MRIWARRMSAALVAVGFTASVALADSLEALLSFVFFEYELAYKDAETLICRHIALTADGDYCRARFEILDPASCKVEIVREIRATSNEGKQRDYYLAKEIFTLGNLDLKKIEQESVPEQKATRLRFEGLVELRRHEGHQYAFDLDAKGGYAGCRIDGALVNITEPDCVSRGTKAPTTSNKMALLFGRFNFQKGIDALEKLLSEHCPRGTTKS